MYLGVKASSVREGCGKWGVVAVEEIPARSFVCTVAGQVRARPWPPLPPRLLCSTCRQLAARAFIVSWWTSTAYRFLDDNEKGACFAFGSRR